jgi:ElaB/YqjD/DUF883 family membrane-anchored ribosome-binding protein
MTHSTAANHHMTEEPRPRSKDAVETTKEALGNAFEATRETGTEALKTVQDAGQAVVRDSTDLVRDAHTDLNSAVRRNPTLAVVGALGVGMLLGLALKQRS